MRKVLAVLVAVAVALPVLASANSPVAPRVALEWSLTQPGVAVLEVAPGPETMWLCAYKQTDLYGHVFLGCTREAGETLSLTFGPGDEQEYRPQIEDSYYVAERRLDDVHYEYGPMHLPEAPIFHQLFFPLVAR